MRAALRPPQCHTPAADHPLACLCRAHAESHAAEADARSEAAADAAEQAQAALCLAQSTQVIPEGWLCLKTQGTKIN